VHHAPRREPANDREGIALADTSQLNLFGTVPRRREGGANLRLAIQQASRVTKSCDRAARSESRPSSTAQRRRVREPCGSLAGCVTEISCSTRRSFADVQSPVTISTRSAPRPTRPVSHSRHNLPGGRNDTVERLDRDWLPGPRRRRRVKISTSTPYGNSDQFARKAVAHEDHADRHRGVRRHRPSRAVRDELGRRIGHSCRHSPLQPTEA